MIIMVVNEALICWEGGIFQTGSPLKGYHFQVRTFVRVAISLFKETTKQRPLELFEVHMEMVIRGN